MKILNRRAIVYVISISMISNPAFASGLTELLSKGGAYLRQTFTRSGKAAEVGTSVESGLLGAKPTLASALKFVDPIEQNSAGLFKDLTKRVHGNIYNKTLGRSTDVVKLITRLANTGTEGVALEGAEGIGKSQIVIGLQEQINIGTVPLALKNARIIQVATDNYMMNSAETIGRQVETLASVLESETSVVIIHFDNIIRYLTEHEAKKFDEVTELLRRKMANKNIQVKYIIEGHLSQIDLMAEKNASVKLFSRQSVEELPEQQLENIVTAFSKKLGSETGYYASPDAIKKIMTLARIYYGRIGMPTAANKLLSDVISLKTTLLGMTDSIIATDLGKKKEILQAELEMAQKIMNESRANGKSAGRAYARQRLNAIPGELSALDVEINKVTANFKKFEDLRDELNRLTVVLKNAESTGQNSVGSETRQLFKSATDEIRKISVEDVALQIHLDKGVSLEELLVQYRPLALEESIQKYQKKLFGQAHIIQTLAEYGQRIRSTVRDINKPAAKILLLGPPGTGKTEAARTAALVEYGSYEKMIRLDMADYSEKYATSGITGAKPGYAGYGDGNDIVTRINNMPESVVLLDEIEKADMSVINNSFLAMLSTGKMINGSGKIGDFSRSIVVATTNKGQHFTSAATRAEIETYMIAEGFSREFLDRWDEILVADPIERSLWSFIFDKNIAQMNADNLARSLNHLQVTPRAIDEILSHVTVGASESARAVEREVAKLTGQIANILEKGFYKNSVGESIQLNARPGDLLIADWDDTAGLVIKIAE